MDQSWMGPPVYPPYQMQGPPPPGPAPAHPYPPEQFPPYSQGPYNPPVQHLPPMHNAQHDQYGPRPPMGPGSMAMAPPHEFYPPPQPPPPHAMPPPREIMPPFDLPPPHAPPPRPGMLLQGDMGPPPGLPPRPAGWGRGRGPGGPGGPMGPCRGPPPMWDDRPPLLVDRPPQWDDRPPHWDDRPPHRDNRPPHPDDRSPHWDDRSPERMQRGRPFEGGGGRGAGRGPRGGGRSGRGGAGLRPTPDLSKGFADVDAKLKFDELPARPAVFLSDAAGAKAATTDSSTAAQRAKLPIVLFDLNGTLTSHTAQRRSSGITKVRPGIEALARALSGICRVGVYSSATHRTVLDACALIEAECKGCPLFEPGLILHRDHTQPAPKDHVKAGGKTWDTVKPLGRWFKNVQRVILVDDDEFKALPEERGNMLLVPCWEDGQQDCNVLPRLAEALKQELAKLGPDASVKPAVSAVSALFKAEVATLQVHSDGEDGLAPPTKKAKPGEASDSNVPQSNTSQAGITQLGTTQPSNTGNAQAADSQPAGAAGTQLKQEEGEAGVGATGVGAAAVTAGGGEAAPDAPTIEKLVDMIRQHPNSSAALSAAMHAVRTTPSKKSKKRTAAQLVLDAGNAIAMAAAASEAAAAAAASAADAAGNKAAADADAASRAAAIWSAAASVAEKAAAAAAAGTQPHLTKVAQAVQAAAAAQAAAAVAGSNPAVIVEVAGSDYLEAFPKCKRLMDYIKTMPGHGNKTPSAVLQEFSHQRNYNIVWLEAPNVATGPFTVMCKLTDKATESEMEHQGQGTARTKKDARHVASAACLESLLPEIIPFAELIGPDGKLMMAHITPGAVPKPEPRRMNRNGRDGRRMNWRSMDQQFADQGAGGEQGYPAPMQDVAYGDATGYYAQADGSYPEGYGTTTMVYPDYGGQAGAPYEGSVDGGQMHTAGHGSYPQHMTTTTTVTVYAAQGVDPAAQGYMNGGAGGHMPGGTVTS